MEGSWLKIRSAVWPSSRICLDAPMPVDGNRTAQLCEWVAKMDGPSGRKGGGKGRVAEGRVSQPPPPSSNRICGINCSSSRTWPDTTKSACHRVAGPASIGGVVPRAPAERSVRRFVMRQSRTAVVPPAPQQNKSATESSAERTDRRGIGTRSLPGGRINSLP
jgi:hypothetical protein